MTCGFVYDCNVHAGDREASHVRLLPAQADGVRDLPLWDRVHARHIGQSSRVLARAREDRLCEGANRCVRFADLRLVPGTKAARAAVR